MKGSPWIDSTWRPPGDPDIDLNPINGDLEISWNLALPDDDGLPITGRFSVLVSREVAEQILKRARELLNAAAPPITVIVLANALIP